MTTLMQKYRQQVEALPSDLPTIVRVREHVREGVANYDPKDPDNKEVLRVLRYCIHERFRSWGRYSTGFEVDITISTKDDVPPLPCNWRARNHSLVAAIKELRAPRESALQGLHTDHDRLRAASLLLEMLADLEQAEWKAM